MAQLKSTYSDGEIISHQGEAGSNKWKILSGEVSFFSETTKGSVFQKKLTPGDVFGEVDILNKYTAKAHGNTVLQSIDMSSGDIPAITLEQSEDKKGFLSVLSKTCFSPSNLPVYCAALSMSSANCPEPTNKRFSICEVSALRSLNEARRTKRAHPQAEPRFSSSAASFFCLDCDAKLKMKSPGLWMKMLSVVNEK